MARGPAGTTRRRGSSKNPGTNRILTRSDASQCARAVGSSDAPWHTPASSGHHQHAGSDGSAALRDATFLTRIQVMPHLNWQHYTLVRVASTAALLTLIGGCCTVKALRLAAVPTTTCSMVFQHTRCDWLPCSSMHDFGGAKQPHGTPLRAGDPTPSIYRQRPGFRAVQHCRPAAHAAVCCSMARTTQRTT